MQIFIMRHGEAALSQFSDRDRPLTPYGIEQSSQTAKWLEDYLYQSKNRLEYALVSPYTRAQQTFKEMIKWVNVERELSCSDIVPSGDPALAQSYIDYLIKEKSLASGLLLVSHMPFVSYLLDSLCESVHSMIFATAAIVVVEYDLESGKGTLIGKYTP